MTNNITFFQTNQYFFLPFINYNVLQCNTFFLNSKLYNIELYLWNTINIEIFVPYLTKINNFSINLFNLYFIILFFVLTIKFCFEKFTILLKYINNINLFLEKNILIWINFFFITFESYEETLCIFIFWPWCIFLIFTHIFQWDNLEIYFIFIEWGLPIIYGYCLLWEYIYLFGAFFFLYLNGSHVKKFFFINILEDIWTFIIFLARITMQAIRGLICGFFHDCFRELSEILLISSFHIYKSIYFFKNLFPNYLFLIFNYTISLYLFSIILFGVYFILFLQLFFLILMIWLFARCWFISYSRVKENFSTLFN